MNNKGFSPERKLPMSYARIWIHSGWGTKDRYPYRVHGIKTKIIEHIKENAKNKQNLIDSLDGHSQHLHCLMALNADMSSSKAMQLGKGGICFLDKHATYHPVKI